MARAQRRKATTTSAGKFVPETRTRKGGNLKRETKSSPQPTVIEAGKSKLSDARSPLVIQVTNEQAQHILDFTTRGES
jgi:hypothetical protein